MSDQVQYILGRYVLNGLVALLVMGIVASLVSPLVPDEQWLSIDERQIHAAWDPDANAVELSLSAVKNMECHRVIVGSTLRAIDVTAGQLTMNQIAVKSRLREKIERMKVGQQATPFDRAEPTRPLKPGHYLMSLTVYCELPPPPQTAPDSLPNSPVTLASKTVETVIVIDPQESDARLSDMAKQ